MKAFLRVCVFGIVGSFCFNQQLHSEQPIPNLYQAPMAADQQLLADRSQRLAKMILSMKDLQH